MQYCGMTLNKCKTTSTLTGCSIKWPGQGYDSSWQLLPQAVCLVMIPSNFSVQFHSQSWIPPVGSRAKPVAEASLLILIFLSSFKIWLLTVLLFSNNKGFGQTITHNKHHSKFFMLIFILNYYIAWNLLWSIHCK